MSKELKITPEQLEKIQAQQNVRVRLLHDIGAVEAQKFDLMSALTNVAVNAKETAEELEKDYGKININLEDGTYEEVVLEEDDKQEVEVEVEEEK
tara:strand:+ start:1512 stop:1796 length:285 start_codon:yes stop_codon:yes gene_type:complete